MIGKLSLALTITAALLITESCTSQSLRALSGSLPTDLIYFKERNQSRCACRMKCLVQPACKAVTADADSTTGNASTCLYSKLAVTASVLLQSNQSKAVTFVKCQRAACAAPFREVEGVGCIYTSDRAATLQEAEQLCSGHSQQLYAPPTDAALKNLIKLMLNESQSTMGYWLGLKLIEGQTRSWQWFNGRTQTSETGQGFWIRTDPNNNETCARLAIHATKQNTTGLASTECDRDFNYVCQMHLCDEAY